MEIKKNITLIIGIAIPIIMVIFIAISVYLPGFFVQPNKYSFLYVSGNDYYSTQYQYSVQNGKLIKNEIQSNIPKPIYEPSMWVSLYVYDAKTNTSHEVSFEEAQSLNLDPNTESPDGFSVVRGNQNGGFLFFSSNSDHNKVYLTGYNVSKKTNLRLDGDNFRFIGWIK